MSKLKTRPKYTILQQLTVIMLLYTATLIPVISAKATDVTSKRLSTMNGLPSNKVYSMLQDKRGFIWLGTANGLSRYDGYSLLTYDMTGNNRIGLLPAHIREIYYDAKHELLWIKSRNKCYSCYDLNRAEFIDYTNGKGWRKTFENAITNDDINVMFDKTNGVRIVTYDNAGIKYHEYNTNNKLLPKADIQDVATDWHKNVWLLTNKGLYAATSNGTIKKIRDGIFIGGGSHNGMTAAIDIAGNIYMYNENLKQTAATKSMSLHNTGEMKGKIVWRGKLLMFFKDTTISVDLKTLKTTPMPNATVCSSKLYPQEINGNFFVSSDEGLLKIFCANGQIKTENLLKNSEIQRNRGEKYRITHIEDNKYAIATYGNGAFIYDINKGIEKHFSQADDHPIIDTDLLNDIFIDRKGTIWISEEEMGLVRIYNTKGDIIKYALPDQYNLNEFSNTVRHILPNGNGRVMVVTKNNVVYDFNAATGEFIYGYTTAFPIYSTKKDSKGHLWTGTRGNGLYIDSLQYKDKNAKCNLSINDIFDIIEDNHGRIWMASLPSATEGGLLMARLTKDMKLHVKRWRTKSMEVHDLDLDKNGLLWVATGNGLLCVDTKSETITDKDIRCFDKENGGYPFQQLITVKCANNGTIWTGGTGNGIAKCTYTPGNNRLDYQQITTDNGLGSNNVNSLEEDEYGYMWAGTEGGLARIDVESGRLYNYHPQNNIKSNYYHENSSLQLPDGRLLFGCNYGMAIIDAAQAATITQANNNEVQITDLKINNISIYHKNNNIALYNEKQINLSHNENTISVLFSNFDYRNPEAAAYQYYLEGADKTWRNITNENEAKYSLLPPGTYRFHLRTIGRNNEWTKEKTLIIHIAEPWYNTWWAWLLYLSIIVCFVCYLYHNKKEKFKLNQKMQMEKQLTDFRINFFTQMTHEFRTPLAIIHGAVNKLTDPKNTDTKSAIQAAQRGTKRLLRLVNQLIEFRRINTNNMQLQLEKGDIIAFVRDMYQDFWHGAKQKDLSPSFVTFAKGYNMFFDKHIIETIIYNLMSNAVKYTPNGGQYTLRIQQGTNNTLIISMDDSGPGIEAARQADMFKMFMHGHVSQGGMGIGLYTASKMAEIHKGELKYQKSITLGGASFTLTIPADESVYNANDYYKATINKESGKQYSEQDESVIEMLPNAINDYVVAIIEDDPDMQDMIKRELGIYFKVVAYSNGKQGYEGVLKEKPAMVVCDLMLPDMNGFDIARKLKADSSMSNIPFVMLTALDDERTQIKAYQAGVDDYMVKPCNLKILVARMIQLINWAEKSKMNEASATAGNNTPQKIVMSSVIDKNFMETFNSLVEKHLGDPTFTIDTIAIQMHMGRTKLYGKVKELTGVTPNKYIMNARMKKAAKLLETGEYNVAVVSYKVGLEDSSYFNKCFKAYFGVSPSKYGKGKQK